VELSEAPAVPLNDLRVFDKRNFHPCFMYFEAEWQGQIVSLPKMTEEI